MKKLSLDIKKGMEAVAGAVQKTTDVGKAVAIGVQGGMKEYADQTKKETYERKLKKYNPLFPEKYRSEDFNIPNMIMIVDDAERRGIDVCEGAIGWLDKKNDVEILCLYDEAVAFSGLQFVPAAICDAVYYVDSFDRSRFVRLDHFLKKADEEKAAELEHIAFCLGAKRFSVQILEKQEEQSVIKNVISGAKNVIRGVENADAKAEVESITTVFKMRGAIGKAEFSGNQTIRRPELKWFRYDENIKRLIEMRLEGKDTVLSKELKLEGASSATISQKTALAVDAAVKGMGISGTASLEKQMKRESNSLLQFYIEF